MSNQLVGSTSRKKMAKVTVGKSTCLPVRRLRGAPLSHQGSRERCQGHGPRRDARHVARKLRAQRIENTTDTCTKSSWEPVWIGTRAVVADSAPVWGAS